MCSAINIAVWPPPLKSQVSKLKNQTISSQEWEDKTFWTSKDLCRD